jgi:hypothetical protein
MEFKMRQSLELGIVLAAIVPLVMAGCGSSSSSAPAAGGTSTDVRSALNQTLQNGEVVIAQFRRSNLSAISNVAVSYTTAVTNTPGITDGVLTIDGGTTDETGQANMALAAGAYKQVIESVGTELKQVQLSASASAVNAVTSTLIDVNVGGAAPAAPQLNVHRGEEYMWNITTPAASSVTVTLVQVDPATGLPNYGSGKYQVSPLGSSYYVGPNLVNPVVLTASSSVAASSFTSSVVRTEVLPGSYRAVIEARGTTGLVAAPFVSNVFTSTAATANTASAVVQAATLQAGIDVTVRLLDTAGNALSGEDVEFYDATTYVPLATVETVSGNAVLKVPTGTTSVIAKAEAGSVSAYYVFTNLATQFNVTLRQFTVAGSAAGLGCTLNAATVTNASVEAVQNVAALQGSPLPAANIVETTILDNGNYTGLTLFGDTTAGAGLQYTLTARKIKTCPTPTASVVTLNTANVTGQVLAVAPGGTVSGMIFDRTIAGTATALGDVDVDVWQSTATGFQLINSDNTNAAGSKAIGNYSIDLPYGTYMLWANGSVTENIVISAATPTFTQNLMQYHLVGAISKNTVGALQVADRPTVRVGTYDATANSNGVYSIRAMEGKTWFCVQPGGNDLAYATQCNMNVRIDATTVAAAGQ